MEGVEDPYAADLSETETVDDTEEETAEEETAEEEIAEEGDTESGDDT